VSKVHLHWRIDDSKNASCSGSKFACHCSLSGALSLNIMTLSITFKNYSIMTLNTCMLSDIWLSISNKPIMLSVVTLSVVMLVSEASNSIDRTRNQGIGILAQVTGQNLG
jgi:hypothetical protein